MYLKRFLKRLAPSWSVRMYHRSLAILAGHLFGNPGRKLKIIGVTGTNGKSTVVTMVGHILRSTGKRVAWMSTATERIGDREWLNERKMTMPGHGVLQRFMRSAVHDGCTHAIIEVSSQGVAQARHIGIPFDVGVFLNITPEHIEAHGSFWQYRDAKLQFFRSLSSRRILKFGKLQDRAIVINIDDENGLMFFSVKAEAYYATSRSGKTFMGFNKIFSPHDINVGVPMRTKFTVEGEQVDLPMMGLFNIDNVLSAIAACYAVGVSVKESARALSDFPGVPGRLETILENPFRVIVDYAPEPASMQALYSVVDSIPHKRIIHVFGSAGGGRDVARRPVLGSFVGSRADIAIITNEDPYDEPPMDIIEQIAEGVRSAGKLKEGTTYFKIKDRREAIAQALRFARPDDLVLITGKACEQWIMGPLGTKKAWDDRRVTREELARAGYLSTKAVYNPDPQEKSRK